MLHSTRHKILIFSALLFVRLVQKKVFFLQLHANTTISIKINHVSFQPKRLIISQKQFHLRHHNHNKPPTQRKAYTTRVHVHRHPNSTHVCPRFRAVASVRGLLRAGLVLHHAFTSSTFYLLLPQKATSGFGGLLRRGARQIMIPAGGRPCVDFVLVPGSGRSTTTTRTTRERTRQGVCNQFRKPLPRARITMCMCVFGPIITHQRYFWRQF